MAEAETPPPQTGTRETRLEHIYQIRVCKPSRPQPCIPALPNKTAVSSQWGNGRFYAQLSQQTNPSIWSSGEQNGSCHFE
jgi:hypothetical protein